MLFLRLVELPNEISYFYDFWWLTFERAGHKDNDSALPGTPSGTMGVETGWTTLQGVTIGKYLSKLG